MRLLITINSKHFFHLCTDYVIFVSYMLYSTSLTKEIRSDIAWSCVRYLECWRAKVYGRVQSVTSTTWMQIRFIILTSGDRIVIKLLSDVFKLLHKASEDSLIVSPCFIAFFSKK